MAYSTLENIKNIIPMQELINLTNDTTPAEEINVLQVENAVEYADELINSYLRNKYVLPLKFVPLIIRQLSTDIAAYRIYSRRPRKLPEHIKTNYDEAKNVLSKLQKEEMILDLPNEHQDKTVTVADKMVVTNKTKSSRIFSDDLMKGFSEIP